MPLVRLLVRGSIIGSLIVIYMLTGGMLHLVVRHERWRQKMIVFLGHNFAKLWVFIFNIHIECKASVRNVQEKETFLILSNHLSYMDIPIIFSHFPCLFVTSVEVKQTPFLGHFCRAAACFFVERRKRAQIKDEVAKLRQVLTSGISLGLFPEGTSTNGASVLPFRKSLLESVVGTEIKLLPLCLNYKRIDGVPLSKLNRDRVCWYGDMAFLPHFLGLLASKRIDVELACAPAFYTQEGMDRKVITEKAYSAIAALHACTS